MVSKIIVGVGGLVVLTIVVFVIITSMLDAELLDAGEATASVTDETGAYLNTTSYVTALANGSTRNFAITAACVSDSGMTIESGNYSINNTGALTNSSTGWDGIGAGGWGNVTLNYTYVIPAMEEFVADDLSFNLSSGVNNVSEKIPTILLVGAIVLLLGILTLLVIIARRGNVFGSQGSL